MIDLMMKMAIKILFQLHGIRRHGAGVEMVL